MTLVYHDGCTEQKRMEELEFVAGLIDQLKDVSVKHRVSALNSVERIGKGRFYLHFLIISFMLTFKPFFLHL